MMEDRSAVIACDDLELVAQFGAYHTDLAVTSLAEFSPDGKPAIIVIKPSNMTAAYGLIQQVNTKVLAQSVITGRMPPGECVPVQQHQSTVLLPWCSDTAYDRWIKLLLGVEMTPVFPEWFFLRACDDYGGETIQRLHAILQSLQLGEPSQLILSNLAEATNCSPRYLLKIFQKHFGIKPGSLLRALELFAVTAQLMQEESKLLHCKRRGFSPLKQTKGDYPRRLQRLLGITYTDLLESGKSEHWAAVWMRRWRERMFRDAVMP